MSKLDLEFEDSVESRIATKANNLEKNLPMVILEINLSFEVMNISIPVSDTVNLEQEANYAEGEFRPFQYLFSETAFPEKVPGDQGIEEIRNKTSNLLIKDTSGALYNRFFKNNQYNSKALVCQILTRVQIT